MKNFKYKLLILLVVVGNSLLAQQQMTTGKIQDNFSIDKNGAVAYSIPIAVPPGIGKIQPKISLQYTSQMGNGPLGIGWALGGVSAVERTGAIQAIDQFSGGINYDSNDRFALNGSRLIAIQGDYGSNGSVYHTEIESWTKVTFFGQQGSGPDSIVAVDRNGWTYNYGTTSDSKILADGQESVRVWALHQMTDRIGNTIVYTYTQSPTDIQTSNPITCTGDYYISQIDYTSNTGAGVKANRSMVFKYESRPDTLQKYIGGSVIQTAARLARVETYVANAQLVHQYDISYSTSGTPSTISSITQSGPNQKLPSTLFNWQQMATQFSFEANVNSGFDWTDLNTYPISLADVNGDGRQDLVSFKEGVRVALANGNTTNYFDAPVSWAQDFSYDLVKAWSNEQDAPRYLVDVNNDGLADILGFFYYGVKVATSDGQKSFQENAWNQGNIYPHYGQKQNWDNYQDYPVVFGDVNGDKIMDIVGFGQSSVEVSLGTGTSFQDPADWIDYFTNQQHWTADEIRLLADVNGDGNDDIVAFSTDSVLVALSTGSSFKRGLWGNGKDFPYFGSKQNWDSSQPRTMADVNGDGLPDIVAFGPSAVQVALSTGKAFTTPENWINQFTKLQHWQATDIRQLTDVNGDGMADIVGINTNGLLIGISTGMGFDVSLWNNGKADGSFSTGHNGWNQLLTSDITGEGLTDIVCFGGNGVSLGTNMGPVPNKLSQITDGIGNQTKISYATLANSSVYSANNELALGKTTIAPPMNANIPYYKTESLLGGNNLVVQSYSYSNDPSINVVAYQHNYQYSYENASIDLTGRGWQGFATIHAQDMSEGNTTTLNVLQPFPYTGRVAKSSVACNSSSKDPNCKNGAVLSSNSSTYSNANDAYYNPYPKVYQVLQKSGVSNYFDYGTYKFSLGTNYDYDTYGNTTFVSQLNYTDSAGVDTKAQDNSYRLRAYKNDVQSNDLGQLLVSKLSSSADTTGLGATTCTNNPSFDNTTDFSLEAFAYNDKGALVSQCSWDNDSTVNSWLKESYTYDAFGNTLSYTSPAGNTTSQTYESTYNSYKDKITLPAGAGGNNLVAYYGYDPRFGQKVARLDFNGYTHINVLDDFGRKVAQQGPLPVDSNGQSDQNNVTDLVTGSQNFSQAKVLTLKSLNYSQEQDSLYLETNVLQSWPTTQARATRWHKVYFDGLGRHYRQVSAGDCNDGKGNIIVDHQYDAGGQPVATSYPYFQKDPIFYKRYERDEYKRITRITDPFGANGADSVVTTYTYQGTTSGDNVTITYGVGSSDTYSKTIVNQFFSQKKREATLITPGNVQTQFGYDVLGRSIWATDPVTPSNPKGVTSTVKYDSKGRKSEIYNPANGRVSFIYDKDGNYATRIDNKGTTQFSYDHMDRLINKQLADGSQVLYHYDSAGVSNGMGRRTSVKVLEKDDSMRVLYTYSYDTYGHKSKSTFEANGLDETYTSQELFDPRGRTIQLTFPDGTSQENVYKLCQLDSINWNKQNIAVYQDFTALGAPQQIRFGNGVIESYQFDPTGLLLSRKIMGSDSDVLIRDSLTWNKLEQITDIQDLTNGSTNYSQSFQYENLRLTQANAPGTYGKLAYAYDNSGNLTQKEGIDYNYSGHQVTSGLQGKDTVYTASYDKMGSMSARTASGVTFDYTYDSENHLLSATNQQSEKSTFFSYNNAGQRIQKELADGTKFIYVNKNFEVVIQPNGQRVHRKFINDPSGKIATVVDTLNKATTIQYSHKNNIQSTVLVTNEQGKLQTRAFYKPYGGIYKPQADFTANYAGKSLDSSTDLYYYGARYFDANIGRFITSDTQLGGAKTQQDALNRYEYVLGNPVIYNDPSGRCAKAVGRLFLAGAVGTGGGITSDIAFHTAGSLAGWGAVATTVGGTGAALWTAAGACAKDDLKDKVDTANKKLESTEQKLDATQKDLTTTKNDLASVKKDLADAKDQITQMQKSIDEGFKKMSEQIQQCKCFSENTLVQTVNGKKPIKDVQVGDHVWSLDSITGHLELKPVVHLMRRITQDLVVLSLSKAKTVSFNKGAELSVQYAALYQTKVTPNKDEVIVESSLNHRYWVLGKGWILAKNLKTGDLLISKDKGVSRVLGIEQKRGIHKVYNFTVADNHNYFVSENALLVHNDCPLQEANTLDNKSVDVTEGSNTSEIAVSEANATEAGGTTAETTAAGEGAEAVSAGAEAVEGLIDFLALIAL